MFKDKKSNSKVRLDISEVTEQLSNLLINSSTKSNCKTNKMSSTYNMVKEDYDHIPYYDGNPEDLIFFVNAVKLVYETVCNDTNTLKIQNHARLLSKVTSRLIGNARHCLLTNTFVNVFELLDHLQKNFKDSRTVEQLKVELTKLRSGPREHPLSFIERVAKIRALMFSRIKLDEEIIDKAATMKLQDKEISYHIKANLHPELCNFLNTLSLTNIDDIRNAIQNDCAFILDRIYGYQYQYNPKNNFKYGNNKPYFNTYNTRPNRNPNFHYGYNPNNSYNPSHNYKPNYTPNHNYNHNFNHDNNTFNHNPTPNTYFNSNPNFHVNSNPQNHDPNSNQNYNFSQHRDSINRRINHQQGNNFQRFNWEQQRQKTPFPTGPFKPDTANTVSMRTVSAFNAPVNHLVQGDNEIADMKQQLETLTNRFDNFLGPSQPESSPNIP